MILRDYTALSLPDGKDGEDYLVKCAKIRGIFEGNSILWKNFLRSALAPRYDWALFFLPPGLFTILGYAFWRSPFVLSAGSLAAAVWSVFLLAISLYKSSSAVCLRYSHTGGGRVWLRENRGKIAIAALSAAITLVLKALFDRLWPHSTH